MPQNKYLTTPEQFLEQLDKLPPGWAETEGGLLEVVKRLGQFQDELNNQSQQIAAVRAAAVTQLLKSKSGAEIARELGLGRANISRLSKAQKWSNPTW
ncbi:hypothetical protein ACN08Y_09955 [Rothia sp. P5764]|uniref:hypothetical protein n=1 Tax=Rothia sp. P5764 TaxID=3402654 RepID=UPI003ABF6E2F